MTIFVKTLLVSINHKVYRIVKTLLASINQKVYRIVTGAAKIIQNSAQVENIIIINIIIKAIVCLFVRSDIENEFVTWQTFQTHWKKIRANQNKSLGHKEKKTWEYSILVS